MSTNARVILIVNPNTNTSTTAMMRELAAAELGDSGLEVVGITVLQGPKMLIDPENFTASAEYVQDVVHSYLAGPEGSNVAAIVIAAIGDPGWQELSDEVQMPVVGIGEAAILAASEQGRPFGMATSTPLLVPSLTRLVAKHGQAAQFCGVKLTASEPLALAADPQEQFRQLRQAVLESVASGAQAVIIAGGPLSETARRLSAEGVAVIIEPIPNACRLVLRKLRTDPLVTPRSMD